MTPEARVEAALASARAARAASDLSAAAAALDDVTPASAMLGADHPLTHRLLWRRAKLAHDLGDAHGAVSGLAPLLDGAPFEHHPAGLEACAPLAHGLWRDVGYRSPVLRALLQHAHTAHLALGDPYRAYQALVWRAWDLACAGDLDELSAVLEQFSRLLPDALAGGPTRHSRASDAATSVPWLQQDLARTALRAGTWANQPELVDAAEDLLETSADDAGFEREREYWFLEPLALARLRLERPDPDHYLEAWWALAPELPHPRAGYHRALARSTQVPARAVPELEHAVREARRGAYGAEWEIDPQLVLEALTGEPRPHAHALIEERQVWVFRPRLSAPGP